MYDYKSICESLSSLPSRQYTAVAVACAEKMYPIAGILGLPGTQHFCKNTMVFLREGIIKESSLATAIDYRERLHNIPEYGCEYSSPVAHLVSKSLDLIRLALESRISPETMSAQAAISLILDFMADFDFTASKHDDDLIALSHCSLVSAEEESQQTIITLFLSSTEISPATLQSLRSEILPIADRIESMIPIHCYRYLRENLVGRRKYQSPASD